MSQKGNFAAANGSLPSLKFFSFYAKGHWDSILFA
jgi:hypothetical protein